MQLECLEFSFCKMNLNGNVLYYSRIFLFYISDYLRVKEQNLGEELLILMKNA